MRARTHTHTTLRNSTLNYCYTGEGFEKFPNLEFVLMEPQVRNLGSPKHVVTMLEVSMFENFLNPSLVILDICFNLVFNFDLKN